jgi:hypothetical protein
MVNARRCRDMLEVKCVIGEHLRQQQVSQQLTQVGLGHTMTPPAMAASPSGTQTSSVGIASGAQPLREEGTEPACTGLYGSKSAVWASLGMKHCVFLWKGAR